MNRTDSMIEEQECISFLSFDHGGTLQWYVTVPHNVADDFIFEKVRMFLASVSMSSAVFKPYDTDPFVDSEPDSTNAMSRATYINGADNTMMVAKQIEQGSNEWHGFVVRPSSVVSEQIIISMVDAFEEAAEYLVGNLADKRMKFRGLSENIRRLYSSDNWWRKKSLFIHLRDSLVSLGKSHCRLGLRCLEREESGLQARLPRTTTLSKFRSTLLRWYSCVPSIWVTCLTRKAMYYDNMTIGHSETLLWYYVSVFSIGNRERRHYYVEAAIDETVRLWFRHRDWVTTIQFTANKSFPSAVPRSVRHAADELMEELSESYG